MYVYCGFLIFSIWHKIYESDLTEQPERQLVIYVDRLAPLRKDSIASLTVVSS